MKNSILFALVITSTLSGCGTNPIDRGVSGAGLGAGAGATIGAIVGAPVAGAAALGAAAGGLTGVLTTNQHLDLGDPPWQRTSKAAHTRGTSSATVAWIQSRLNALGYNAGPADGRPGPRTRLAIQAYQRDRGLHVDGQASDRLADLMWRTGT